MTLPPKRPSDLAETGGEDLRAWMQDYGPALRRYFMKRAPAAEAEDLVQDVFLAMHVRGAIEDAAQADRYLFRVAANVMARRRQRRGWDWANHLTIEADGASADDLSPEKILDHKQALARVLVALEELPPRMHAAFVMHRFEDMTYSEIAGRMGLSVRTVENFISRAMKRVLTSMGELR